MLQRLSGRRRRILMTVDAVGGVWQYALGLAEELVRAGDTLVFAGLGPLPTPEQRRQAQDLATLIWLDTPPDWLAVRPSELDGLPAKLERIVRDHAIDLVHLNAPSQAAGLELPCQVVAMSHSCVITWLHAVLGSAPKADWAWHRGSNRAGFDSADLVLAPSESHAAALRDCYGPVPRLRVVHNAVPPATDEAPRENFAFAAGRWWDAGKNGQILDAAAGLAAWPVFAAGPTKGPNGDRLSFLRARPLGAVPNADIRSQMARCGVFVSPSLYEPFGLAALEAATAGTPLVLADIPTYRELWEGAALFFPPRDAAALAGRLDRLAEDSSLRRDFGIASLRRSRRYTLARQADATRAAHDEAASMFAQRQ